jgi:hypothetical protein
VTLDLVKGVLTPLQALALLRWLCAATFEEHLAGPLHAVFQNCLYVRNRDRLSDLRFGVSLVANHLPLVGVVGSYFDREERHEAILADRFLRRAGGARDTKRPLRIAPELVRERGRLN